MTVTCATPLSHNLNRVPKLGRAKNGDREKIHLKFQHLLTSKLHVTPDGVVSHTDTPQAIPFLCCAGGGRQERGGLSAWWGALPWSSQVAWP